MPAQPKRILVVSYEFPPLGGGGAKVVDGLISRLVQRGWVVDLVTMGFRGLPRTEKRNRLTIHRVPGIRRNQSLCRAYEMIPYVLIAPFVARRLVREHRYDINHTHFIFPDALVSAFTKWSTGLPFVTTAHGSDVPGYNPNRFKLLHRLLAPVWQRLTRYIDRVICPSGFIEKLIRGANPDARTEVIPNGIEPDRFSPDKAKKKQVLCVTRLFERKGVQYLIDGFARANDGTWSLKIVGDGPYLDDVSRQASNVAGIEVLGFLENDSDTLRRLYEESAIFSLPSASENFPIVLLEAMTAGAAIVTTRGTGCEDVVGDTAALVKPRDASEIAVVLERLMHDEEYRRDLARRGRRRMEEYFSWASVVDRHERLFDTVTSDPA